MTDNISKCAVLIPSCDAYSDLWVPFFELWKRHWPDCPFKVYLGTNAERFTMPGVTNLHSTHGLKWAERTRDHLEQIGEPIVLLWLEDFFLRRPVPTAEVCRLLGDFEATKAHMLRLVNRPGPRYLLPKRKYGPCLPGEAYRVSTQAALWRRSTLLALIEPGESIWSFELIGTKRSSRYPDGFFAVAKDVVPYRHHVVERGKWFPWDAYHFKRMSIGCDFSRRKIMSPSEASRWLVRKLAGMSGLKRLLRPAKRS